MGYDMATTWWFVMGVVFLSNCLGNYASHRR